MIHARGLARTFQTRRGRERAAVTAVAGVSFDVEAGEVVGFLGPNGAGKSTTLRMLTTLLVPTSGAATVNGHDLSTEALAVRRSIGYVSQSGSTSSLAIAGREIVDHGMLYGISKQQATRRGRELFDQLELDGMWDRPTKSMSGGQRRRLDIAMGLVHDPRLVFLDEPTTGLDPQARANLWKHISDLRSKRGSTVFLTTHYLDEADALCDRILVIDNGSIVASDTPEALKRQVSGDLVSVTVSRLKDVVVAAELLTRVADGATAVESRCIEARVHHGARELPGLVRALDSANIALDAIDVRRPTLDDVFLNMTGRSLRENA